MQTYYGTQNERVYQRAELNKTIGEWDVCITTYNLAQGNEHDRKFFKKIDWDVRMSFLDLVLAFLIFTFVSLAVLCV